MSPNLPEKFFVQLSPANFLPQRSSRPFYGVTSTKGLRVFFLQTLGAIFWSKQRWVPFLPGFSGILPIFSANQNFWRWTRTPNPPRAPPTPTSDTTAFHSSVISNFVIYQDQLETNLLQLFGHPENLEWFSIISVIIFEVNIFDEQKQT